jgi:hypothetical protein
VRVAARLCGTRIPIEANLLPVSPGGHCATLKILHRWVADADIETTVPIAPDRDIDLAGVKLPQNICQLNTTLRSGTRHATPQHRRPRGPIELTAPRAPCHVAPQEEPLEERFDGGVGALRQMRVEF